MAGGVLVRADGTLEPGPPLDDAARAEIERALRAGDWDGEVWPGGEAYRWEERGG